jgi:MFS family permease
VRRDVAIRRTERWFVSQGVPNLIADYRFRSHVLPRMLPFLVTAIVGSVTLAVLLPRAEAGPGAVAVALGLLLVLLCLPWLLARLGRRMPRLSRNSATPVLIAFAVTPLLIPLLLIGAYGRPDRALVIGRAGTPTVQVAVVTGLVLVAAFVAIFVLSWFVTAYGLVPLAVLATRHAVSDMRGSLQLQGRAMPSLLFVTFFLFFTGELWQLMNHLAWGRLVLVLALFAAVTVLATSARLRGEIDRVEQDLSPQRLSTAFAGTPLATLTPTTQPTPPPPLTARQETNVLMVLATRQLVQAAVVGLGLFAFFVTLGLIIVDHTTAATWIGDEPQRSAWVPFIPVALLRAAALLAGFGSMYFAITTMTQKEYRQEFFEPVISDVERTLAVRAAYLGLRSEPLSSQAP